MVDLLKPGMRPLLRLLLLFGYRVDYYGAPFAYVLQSNALHEAYQSIFADKLPDQFIGKRKAYGVDSLEINNDFSLGFD